MPGADLLPAARGAVGTARDRLLGRGGARRPAAVPARAAAPAAPTSTGAPRSGCATRPRRRPSRCRGACASACSWPGPPTARRRSTSRAPRSWWPPRPAPAPAPQLVLRGAGRRRGAGGVAPAAVRGGGARRRAGAAVRAARRRHAGRPARAPARRSAAGRRLHGAHRGGAPASSNGRAWPSDFEALFDEIAARRHGDGRPDVQRRLAQRDFIHVDLHMHTDHSPDCATPVPTRCSRRPRGWGSARSP